MEVIVKMILSTLELMNRNLCHLAANEPLERLDHPPAGPSIDTLAQKPQRVHEGTTDTHRLGVLERLLAVQDEAISRLRQRLDQLQAHANAAPQRSRWDDEAIDQIVQEGRMAIDELQRARLS